MRLNDGPDERPLLLFHAVGGTVYAYGPLARELAADYQVWGAPFPNDLDEEGLSLDALIEHHLTAVRRTQPAGPYRLAGWSMGGVLAFEIARRLEAAGESIGFVGLLDTPFWLPHEPEPKDNDFAGFFVKDAARSLGPVPSTPPDPRTSTASEQLHWLATQLDTAGEPRRLMPELEQRYATFRTNTRILSGYWPSGTLCSDALIVHPEESLHPAHKWNDVILGAVTTLTIKGNHYTFLQPPLVSPVAAAFREIGASAARRDARP